MLLARLLSWLHLTHVVCPGSPDCLRFVLVLGERQAGKASLFTRLVDAPAEYASQLGGASAAAAEEEEGLDGTTGMGAEVRSNQTCGCTWDRVWQTKLSIGMKFCWCCSIVCSDNNTTPSDR